MRNFAYIKKMTVGLTLGAMLALSAVVPAFADEAAVSQTVNSGSLASTVTTAPAFPAVTYSHTVQTSTATTKLSIEVDDTRGSGEGWTVTLGSSDLAYDNIANPDGTNILASAVSASDISGATVVAGDDLTGVTPGTAGALGAPRTVLQATAGNGEGTYTQIIGLAIEIPAQAAAGSYTGTLTLTTGAAPAL